MKNDNYLKMIIIIVLYAEKFFFFEDRILYFRFGILALYIVRYVYSNSCKEIQSIQHEQLAPPSLHGQILISIHTHW